MASSRASCKTGFGRHEIDVGDSKSRRRSFMTMATREPTVVNATVGQERSDGLWR